jgi:hypothetical protein
MKEALPSLQAPHDKNMQFITQNLNFSLAKPPHTT